MSETLQSGTEASDPGRAPCTEAGRGPTRASTRVTKSVERGPSVLTAAAKKSRAPSMAAPAKSRKAKGKERARIPDDILTAPGEIDSVEGAAIDTGLPTVPALLPSALPPATPVAVDSSPAPRSRILALLEHNSTMPIDAPPKKMSVGGVYVTDSPNSDSDPEGIDDGRWIDEPISPRPTNAPARQVAFVGNGPEGAGPSRTRQLSSRGEVSPKPKRARVDDLASTPALYTDGDLEAAVMDARQETESIWAEAADEAMRALRDAQAMTVSLELQVQKLLASGVPSSATQAPPSWAAGTSSATPRNVGRAPAPVTARDVRTQGTSDWSGVAAFRRPFAAVAAVAPAPATRRILAASAMEVKHTIDPQQVVFPELVVSSYNASYSHYLPLDIFEPAALREAEVEAVHTLDNQLTVDKDGVLRPSRTRKVDYSQEYTLPMTKWLAAFPYMCLAFSLHLRAFPEAQPGDAHAQAFAADLATHFQRIASRDDFESRFPLYREYSARVLRLHHADPVSTTPAEWHESLFASICRKHDDAHRAVANARWTSLEARLADIRTSASLRLRGPAPGGPSSSRDSAPTVPRGMGAFVAAVIFCMYCGRSSHRFSSCTDAGCYLKRSATGHWADGANRRFCQQYNGPAGCRRGRGGHCQYVHACSLCGDAAHGAQACSKVQNDGPSPPGRAPPATSAGGRA